LIELSGRKKRGQECRILKSRSFKIDNAVKQLKGVLFFDWMAARIDDTLSGQSEGQEMSGTPLSMGLAWSFPIE
jgi:hexokinase